MRQWRQGDVLLEQVVELPHGAVIVSGPTILAHGEVTGHAHAIRNDEAATLWATDDGERFLRLLESAAVEHEEHSPIALEPGVYRIVRQREYSPRHIRLAGD